MVRQSIRIVGSGVVVDISDGAQALFYGPPKEPSDPPPEGLGVALLGVGLAGLTGLALLGNGLVGLTLLGIGLIGLVLLPLDGVELSETLLADELCGLLPEEPDELGLDDEREDTELLDRLESEELGQHT